jgi:predicted GNAT family acetyltransferase
VTEPAAVIVDRPDLNRYQAEIGTEVAGFVDYRRHAGRLVLLHTEVPSEFGGRGIAAQLARHILDQAIATETRVLVDCPFIRSFVERHPEYLRIVTPDRARRPGA